MNYQPIIGLEIHVELSTKSKMFCGCSADYFGKKPNTHTCPVCLGLPGALPVPNKQAIEDCVKIGLALNCQIPLISKFDRKNYFYPDLPKGYQISQYDEPFARHGELKIKNQKSNIKNEEEKIIRIRRVHMEEDTAKLTHQFGNQNAKVKDQNEANYSLIDFNRSGVPLVEIVTEPDFSSGEEVVSYLKKIQQIVRYLGVSNADMEKGDMRLEPNISLREIRNSKSEIRNKELPKYKVEVKNINSFRFVEKAIKYELNRQAKELDAGKTPVQETRGWDEVNQKTVSQRVKEEANDYRYFPEPDIPPFHWNQKYIEELKQNLPELPDEKLSRFQKEYGLSYYDVEILTRDKATSDFFEECVRVNLEIKHKNQDSTNVKTIANWMINRKDIDLEAVLPAELIKRILSATKTARVDDSTLQKLIEKALLDNREAVSDYNKGKQNALMFLVGQVIKQSKEKLNPQNVKDRLLEIIQHERESGITK